MGRPLWKSCPETRLKVEASVQVLGFTAFSPPTKPPRALFDRSRFEESVEGVMAKMRLPSAASGPLVAVEDRL
jgi:hypothetical protein